MSYEVTVIYLDEHDCQQRYTITGDKYLDYQLLTREPVMVRDILTVGLIIKPGELSRSGKVIPPHRIKLVRWSDTLQEDEEIDHGKARLASNDAGS